MLVRPRAAPNLYITVCLRAFAEHEKSCRHCRVLKCRRCIFDAAPRRMSTTRTEHSPELGALSINVRRNFWLHSPTITERWMILERNLAMEMGYHAKQLWNKQRKTKRKVVPPIWVRMYSTCALLHLGSQRQIGHLEIVRTHVLGVVRLQNTRLHIVRQSNSEQLSHRCCC